MNSAYLKQAIAAAERFKETEDERKKVRADLRTRAITEIEGDDRLSTRLSLIPPMDGLGFERIIGRSELINVNYLALGQRASRPVCRVQVRNRWGRPAGFGTGFLVSPNLMMTNHHVLKIDERLVDVEREEFYLTRTLVDLQYEDDLDFVPMGGKSFRLDAQRFFYASEELDFALVAIEPTAPDGTPLADYGYLTLIRPSGKALVSEPVTIIQHPEGATKQIALRDNRITNLLDSFIHYETDTLPGSSGAPVFNDQWEIVALHHSGVPKLRNGKIVAKDGNLWDPSMGDEQVEWIANEGVRISVILEHLASKGDWGTTERRLLTEMGVALTTPIEGQEIEERELAIGFGAIEFPASDHIREPGVCPRIILNEPDSTGMPPRPPQPLTLEQWHELIEDENTTEDDLAPYVVQDDRFSQAFDPGFRFNQALIVDPTALESDRALTWANQWCQVRRHRRYRDRLRRGGNPLRIVSKGDSWFQYPFLLDDVIDNLMEIPDYAVMSLDAAGDLLSNMIASGDYLRAIANEQPRVFLLSGGGNDMVSDRRLASMLHPFSAQRDPRDYLNQNFEVFLLEMRTQYQRLLRSVVQRSPEIRIFCHGYDYVHPNGGRWLGQPMELRRITDLSLQSEIMRVVIDRVNAVLSDVTLSFSSARYLDLRGVVSPGGWYDELHPRDPGYAQIARIFAEAIG